MALQGLIFADVIWSGSQLQRDTVVPSRNGAALWTNRAVHTQTDLKSRASRLEQTDTCSGPGVPDLRLPWACGLLRVRGSSCTLRCVHGFTFSACAFTAAVS